MSDGSPSISRSRFWGANRDAHHDDHNYDHEHDGVADDNPS